MGEGLTRAIRWAERRIGQVLGDSKRGPRPEVPTLGRNFHPKQKAQFRMMASGTVSHRRAMVVVLTRSRSPLTAVPRPPADAAEQVDQTPKPPSAGR